jgi:hypothetical protein
MSQKTITITIVRIPGQGERDSGLKPNGIPG